MLKNPIAIVPSNKIERALEVCGVAELQGYCMLIAYATVNRGDFNPKKLSSKKYGNVSKKTQRRKSRNLVYKYNLFIESNSTLPFLRNRPNCRYLIFGGKRYTCAINLHKSIIEIRYL